MRRLSLEAIVALDEFDDRLPVWVVGLVAARLAERHFRALTMRDAER